MLGWVVAEDVGRQTKRHKSTPKLMVYEVQLGLCLFVTPSPQEKVVLLLASLLKPAQKAYPQNKTHPYEFVGT